MKRRCSVLLSVLLALSLLAGCSNSSKTADSGGDAKDTQAAAAGATSIILSDSGITVDGEAASTDEAAAVYTARDIVYYEAGRDFTYGAGSESDAHSPEEADAHTVVHITQPGTYTLSGTLSAGQVAVDLGDGAEEDPDAVVTLVLNGVDITCTVAPAIIFYRVYECGSADTETASEIVDTTAAGANVLIADGTENTVTGSYVAKIYRPESVALNDDGTEVAEAKKLHKYDGALYSKMSMNVRGGETGTLTICADNEGLDSELHLTIDSGNISILAGNDGINTNEDGVSVTTVNGGTLNIQVTGETGEGDGIDSNGWIVINGGTIVTAACSSSADAGLDADNGILINGGTVTATGNMYDAIDGGDQNTAVFQFAQRQSGGQTYTLKDAAGETVLEMTPANDFQYLVVSAPDLAEGDYTLWQGDTQLSGSAGAVGGPGGMGGGPKDQGEPPADGQTPPERPSDAPDGGAPAKPDGQQPSGSAEGKGSGSRGGQRGEDQRPSEPPEGGAAATGEASVTFTLQAGVSQFTGVTAAG